MTNAPTPHPGPGHPDCHECGGTGTNAARLPCFACHHGANLAARRQPSPYSAAAVEATVDHLRQRIRELEADLAAIRQERDEIVDCHKSAAEALAFGVAFARSQQEATELHDAARAVVEVFNSGCGYLYECDDDDCGALATRFERYSGLNYCDGHAPPGDDTKVVEFDHAPAWRRLCALVKP